MLALPLDEPSVAVPQGSVRIPDRDLAAASVPKRDDRGRTVDVHALSHTFGTLMDHLDVGQGRHGLLEPAPAP
jgi:hypothetical protein